jgi:Ca2+-binding EF-hand superfamily protein
VQPSDAMLDEMLRRCDRNADGYLSFNEFARNFLAQVPP